MAHVAVNWAKARLSEIDGATLSAGDRLTLVLLADAWNQDTGCAFPGRDRLALECGCSPRQVSRYTKRLAELGLIDIQRTRSTNEYYLPEVDEIFRKSLESKRQSKRQG